MADARALLASILLAAVAAQAFVSVVVEARSDPTEKATQDDTKKPDCVPAFDPRSFPGHGGTTLPMPSHGGSGTTPSHGGSGSSPSHGGSGTTPSPSHGGGGGGYGTPPTAPSHGGSGSLPSPSHGGHGDTPAAPSHGGYGASPSTPSTGGGYGSSPTTPSHGGGAYGSSPTTPSHGGAYGSSPTTPSPSHGAYGGNPPSDGGSPTTTSPSGHGSSISTPATPLIPVDPNSPGSCEYWRSHPMEIWSALGRWPSSMGHFLGSPGGGSGGAIAGVSIQDALSNTRADGAGALMREGAAALLNSMTRSGFPYTSDQVRAALAAAAAGGSDGAAAAAFKKANEGGA